MRSKIVFIEDSYSFYFPAALGLAFLFNLFYFNHYFFLLCALVLTISIQFRPLSSKYSQNLVIFCLPLIGAIANYESLCLHYNSIVLFLWCRSFSNFKKFFLKDVFIYFLIIGSWLFYWNPEANYTIYAGAIMHGIMHPLHFFILSSRFKVVHWLTLFIPLWWMLDNIFKFNQLFTAFWDLEILSVYLLWLLNFDREKVVKRVFLFSLPLITFAQMYWDVCPKMFD